MYAYYDNVKHLGGGEDLVIRTHWRIQRWGQGVGPLPLKITSGYGFPYKYF